MKRRAIIHRLAMSGPDDVSAIAALIDAGVLHPQEIIAILGKTEGNGCVNDFSRGYAVQSLALLLLRYLPKSQVDAIPMVMSGGTEGGLSPHWIVLAATPDRDADTKADASADPSHKGALAIASAITRPLGPAEIGRPIQSDLVRAAVIEAMHSARIASPDDVHFVQVKCPLLTAARVAQVSGDVATPDMLKSMGLSRGASALGVALALQEITGISPAQIGRDRTLWSARASCSAGIELMTCEVVVMGLSPHWTGDLRIDHTVMQDAIDVHAPAALIARIAPGAPLQGAASQIHAVLAKVEAASDGTIRGNRHTMLEDSDISSTRHARGFVGGLLAGLVGHTQLFVSGGAEHQGPDGGGPLAMIYTPGEAPT